MENTILKSLHLNKDDNLNEGELFKNLVKELSVLINGQNYNIRPYSEETLKKLEVLSRDAVQAANRKIISNIQLIENSVVSLSEAKNRSMIKNILNIMKLSATSDFLNNITEEDIVEIYSPDGIQIFRNLKFYETTSYSLADLLLYEWYELYSRPTKIYEKLAEYVVYCVTKARPNEIIDLNHIPAHIIKEIKSNPINLLEVKFGKMAPIYSFGGNIAGLIVTCKAKNMLSLSHESISFI